MPSATAARVASGASLFFFAAFGTFSALGQGGIHNPCKFVAFPLGPRGRLWGTSLSLPILDLPCGAATGSTRADQLLGP
jgi:hypothetical protein